MKETHDQKSDENGKIKRKRKNENIERKNLRGSYEEGPET